MQWTVESIPQDATGLALYLDQYKPFRLLSLRNDPSGKCVWGPDSPKLIGISVDGSLF